MEITQIVAIIVIAVIVIAYLAYNIKKKGLRKTAIDLIVEAEKIYSKGDNMAKKTFVVNCLRVALPKPFDVLVTTDMLDKFMEAVFHEIKDALDCTAKEV